MKRTILLILIGAAVGGGIVYLAKTGGGKSAGEEKPAEEEEAKTSITHDTNGNVVVNMNDETQGDAGIKVANPAAAQFIRELKGYGRVLDPAPLSAMATELASDQAAYAVSSNELARLKTLAGQGNTSTRAVQAAEAAAQHDQLAMQSARDRLVLSAGAAVANRGDLPAFIQSLAAQEAALIRIDLPAGETMNSPPEGARIMALSGQIGEAELIGPAPGMDPQTQGRGFIFLTKTNAPRFLPGEAVTGYLKVAGAPVDGVSIPREAVVRTEGSGWIYVLNEGGESFTRIRISLERPTLAGWFVSEGMTDKSYIVVTGAQTLLSEELKASLKSD